LGSHRGREREREATTAAAAASRLQNSGFGNPEKRAIFLIEKCLI
jgi:hypothetical protein